MRPMTGVAVALAALAGEAVLHAAVPETPKNESLYIGAAQFQAIMAKIPPAKESGQPGSFSARMFSASTYSMSFIRLNEPDTPHVHGAWSEVYVIREGVGVLETDGTVTGVTSNDSATHKSLFVDADGNPLSRPQAPTTPRKPTPGDLAGTGIEGGKQQSVKAGDVILIPAGVAHRWLEVSQPVVYLDIKFPKAE
jgi:mannose-6-phosphate isomerase-like protein (cupin superfamily)